MGAHPDPEEVKRDFDERREELADDVRFEETGGSEVSEDARKLFEELEEALVAPQEEQELRSAR